MKIELSLLENGLDFILSAARYLVDEGYSENPSALKYVVLHLSAGVHLILKERLKREHWVLLFSRPGSATRQAYNEGDFRGVSYDDAVKRLESICGVKFSSKQKTTLDDLRVRRNRFEHYGVTQSVEALKSVASQTLNFVLDFVHTELDVTLTHEQKELLEEIRLHLMDFDQFVDDRLEQIKSALDAFQGTVVTCPSCGQLAARIDDGISCAFCNDFMDGESAAAKFVQDVRHLSRYRVEKSGGFWPIHYCMNCGTESLLEDIQTVLNHKGEMVQTEFVCYTCGEYWGPGELRFCSRCGEPYDPGSGEDWTAICPDCWRALIEEAP